MCGPGFQEGSGRPAPDSISSMKSGRKRITSSLQKEPRTHGAERFSWGIQGEWLVRC